MGLSVCWASTKWPSTLSNLHHKLKIFKPSYHLFLSTRTLASLFPSLSMLLFEHEALQWRRRLRVSAVAIEGEAEGEEESESEPDIFNSLARAPKRRQSLPKASRGRFDTGAH